MRTIRLARRGALAATTGLLALGITGCVAGGPVAPQCSAEILETFEASGTISSEFPAPELLSGGGIYCWVGIDSNGELGGLAFFEGADSAEVATDRLQDNGFVPSTMLPSFYEKGDLIAGLTPTNGPMKEGNGVPAELVGKDITILFVGPDPS